MPGKWDDAKPAEKLLNLYTTLLASPRALSLGELADKLCCSKQTVSRLVAQLESSRFGQIHMSKQGREAYYKLERPRRMPNLCLNAEGLTQMALCMDFLSRILPSGMQKAMANTWDSAAAMAVGTSASPVSGLGMSFSKGHIDYEPFEGILNTLIHAISEGRICQVSYRAQRQKEPKSWLFAPKRLISYRECIYVSGYWMPERGEKGEEQAMHLPLQRFVSCEATNRSAQRLPEPPLDLDKLGLMQGEPFDVSVRFTPAAATYAAERQWSADQHLEELADGGIILHVRSHSPEECLAWILGFGPAAQLLEPAWLREKLRQKIAAMAAAYE